MKSRIIGIDPDIDKSGVCCLYTETRQVELMSFRFPALLEYLSEQEGKDDVVVVVEASWKTRHNWHLKFSDKKEVAAAKGYSEGRNHELGQLVVEMCQYWGIPIIEKYPLRKMWRGKDGKITHEELASFVSSLPSRSNQEVRDACLLAWDIAGFPIKIAPIPHKRK